MREKKKLLRNLKTRLEFEENNVFYVCPQGCVRLLFNEATETEFLCPMCGEDLVYYDNSKFAESLKRRVDALNSV
jgi:transcription initiation factor TFIIE subunit alpha